MSNEYYYLNELKIKMSEFLEQEGSDNDFGWIPPLIEQRMAEAAWAVLKNNKELNDYLEKERLLKNG